MLGECFRRGGRKSEMEKKDERIANLSSLLSSTIGKQFRNPLNISKVRIHKSKDFRFLRVKGAKLKLLCNSRNIIQLRSTVPFSKAIAKGCIPEIEGMQPFSVYVLIFNELRSP